MRTRLPNFVLPAPLGAASRLLAVAFAALVLAACATRQSAPVETRIATQPPPPVAAPAPLAPEPVAITEPDTRAQTYTVKRGDTLAQIALDNGLDYRELAGWNNLDNPNVIRVGQVLRLTAPGTVVGAAATPGAATTTPPRPAPSPTEPKPATATPATATASAASTRSDGVKSSPKAIREPYSATAVRDILLAGSAATAAAAAASAPAAAPAPGGDTVAMATPGGPRTDAKSDAAHPAATPTDTSGDEDRLDWSWPVKGKVVGGFSESSNLKGIDIAGTAGQPVLASAAGKVVYAGSGLRGYGKLIIIKHNKTYLSAYAHNRELLVKEGDQVSKGQKIAEMGNTDADQVKLHFEIRRMGKPMDPARYLPPA